MTDQNSIAPITRDQRRQELAELTFTPTAMFQPKTGKELMDMANMMAGAAFMVRDIYRENPGACMGLIAVCAPYGINPLQASWKTYKASKNSDAPIAYEAQLIVAMLNASGSTEDGLHYRYEGEGLDRVCIASATKIGAREPVEVRSPKLRDISPKNSPLWKSDPDQQQAYYTGRNWVRLYQPQMLLGIIDVDEAKAIELGPDKARDITPQEPAEGGFAQRVQAAAEKATPEKDVQDAELADDAPDGGDSAPEEASDTVEQDNGQAEEKAADAPVSESEGEPQQETKPEADAEQRQSESEEAKSEGQPEEAQADEEVDPITKMPWYGEGKWAAEQGFVKRDQCPYPDDPARGAWLVGFDDVAGRDDPEQSGMDV